MIFCCLYCRLLLAKRAASRFAADNVETQPLASPLANAVATEEMKQEPVVEVQAGGEIEVDTSLRRSLQSDFAMSSEAETQNAIDDPTAVEMKCPQPVEMEYPDNQLGLLSSPYSPTSPAPEETEPKVPHPCHQGQNGDVLVGEAKGDADQAMGDAEQVTKVSDPVLPEQEACAPNPSDPLPEDAPELKEVGAEPAEHDQPLQHQELHDSQELEEGARQPICDQQVVEEIASQDEADFVEAMADFGDGGDDDDEEPPVVRRTTQWSLKPPGKPRGRPPKAKPAAEESKVKALPKSRTKRAAPKRKPGARRTKSYITIDDIVPPTPAPPRAKPAGGDAVDGQNGASSSSSSPAPEPPVSEAGAGKRKASKAVSVGRAGKRKARKAVGKSKENEADEVAEETLETKLVWGPVSKDGAEAFSHYWPPPPLQEHAVAEPAERDVAAGPADGDEGQSAVDGDEAQQAADGDKAQPAVRGSSNLPEGDKYPNSFARRPCPKTNQPKHRWMAIVEAFESEIAFYTEYYGLSTYQYEAGSPQPLFSIFSPLPLPTIGCCMCKNLTHPYHPWVHFPAGGMVGLLHGCLQGQ